MVGHQNQCCFSPRLGGALRSHQHSRPDLNEEAPVAAVPQAPLWDPQSWGATSDKSPMKGSESPLTVVAEDPGSPNYRSSPGRARSPAPRSPEKGKSAPDPEAQMLRKPQLYSCYVLNCFISFLFFFWGEGAMCCSFWYVFWTWITTEFGNRKIIYATYYIYIQFV